MPFGLIPLVAGVGDKLSRAVYLAPHLSIDSYTHLFQICISNSHDASQIKLFSLLLGFLYLCCRDGGGRGGKLYRAVYLAPHLGIMFIFL